MDGLFKPVRYLKGVGEKKSEYYEKLGIKTVYDLLYHLPRNYVDFSCPVSPPEAQINENAVFKGTIVKKMPEQYIRKGLSIFKAVATDGTYDFIVIIYNNVYGFRALKEGTEYCFYGKVSGTPLRREISSPRIIKANSEPLQPIYPLTTGITSGAILTNMRDAIAMLESNPFDSMPTNILMENDLMSLPHALKCIHFPKNIEEAEKARRRLAFDELLILQLGLLTLKKRRREKTPLIMKNVDMSTFYNALPFETTNAQKRSANEIICDLQSEYPMNRLLQGDVGSGKTAVAAAACYFTYKNGYQSAVMAPTEILAVQHYNTMKKFLEPLGINVVLLTGSMTAKQKREVKEKLQNGQASVAVGTHAIIQKDVEFLNLGLVITDEQHRFGVAQRAALANKGNSPHKLIMSATPIPRTLALIIYGDLDISIIDEMPKGRQPIKTYAVTDKMRTRVYNFLKNEIDNGSQGYIVCPMIEDSESDLQAVKSYADNIRKNEFADYEVGLLHGKMKADEKNQIMEKFKNGEIEVLVCTTVVEVGVDVPNATIMLIENAERFGLSQLHQLRGRVGRGTKQSHCILITNNTGEDCIKRMKIMSSTSDGFKISEEDLKLRGPGDFFGNRQHGLPPLKIADVAADMKLMDLTKKIAQKIVSEDPELKSREYCGLKLEVIRLFGRNGENSFN